MIRKIIKNYFFKRLKNKKDFWDKYKNSNINFNFDKFNLNKYNVKKKKLIIKNNKENNIEERVKNNNKKLIKV